jgi:hypothetical protein
MQDNAWDLGGGGASFPFDHIGDAVEGFITDAVTRQGTDMNTNEPEWWDKEETRPKLLTLLTLQTTLRDNAQDTGLRTVALSGSKKPNPDGTKSRMCAARTAVLDATGSTAMAPGAWFRMQFTSEGAKTRPAFNPPKFFEAWYRSPVLDLDGQDRTAPANQLPPTYGTTTGTGPGQALPGQNWPTPQGQFSEPVQSGSFSNQQSVNTATGEIRQASDIRTGPLTKAQVEGVHALGGDDAVAAVYGADWQSRLV